MTTPTKRPTSLDDIKNIEVPIGQFSANSVVASRLARAVLVTATDCSDLETAANWIKQVADDGDSTRDKIYLEGGVALSAKDSERGSFGSKIWSLQINSTVPRNPSQTLSKFSGLVGDLSGQRDASENAVAFAALAHAIERGTVDRTIEAYSDALSRLGLIDDSPAYEANVTIEFDRNVMPAEFEVRDWLVDTLRNAPSRPCGSPENWLGDVTVERISETSAT